MKIEYYEKCLYETEKLLDSIKVSLKKAPKGRMRSEMAKGKYPQFYEILKKGDAKGRFMRKEEIDKIKAYAQKEYDIRMLTETEKVKKKLIGLIANWEEIERHNFYSLAEVVTKLSVAKQSYVTPYIMAEDDYIATWMQSFDTEKNSYPIEKGYITERGELVRSKSEKMIADKLYLRGIPYVYEARILLGNNIFFPDFAALNARTRQTFYLEHFGMMDTPEYCRNALEKIEKYDELGLVLGENFIASFESELKGINMEQIDRAIERYLL